MAKLTNLTVQEPLGTPDSDRIRDLAGLQHAVNLETLEFDGARLISNLAPLTSLENLTILKLKGLEQIEDLTPLARLSNLGTRTRRT